MAKNYEMYNAWRSSLEPSLADLFRSFPSLRVDSAQLVNNLSPLMPRFYSIASCMQYALIGDGGVKTSKNTHVDLVLNVVEYKTKAGIEKRGLCSNYLNDEGIGGQVAVYLRSAPTFHLPKLEFEEDVPLVLVGAGSGLAPFRGFWQQVCLESFCVDDQDTNVTKDMLASRARNNRLQLFFGCFDKAVDLLREETDPLASELLTRYNDFLNFSSGARKLRTSFRAKRSEFLKFSILCTRAEKCYIYFYT
jgi:nitric-oxide synthase